MFLSGRAGRRPEVQSRLPPHLTAAVLAERLADRPTLRGILGGGDQWSRPADHAPSAEFSSQLLDDLERLNEEIKRRTHVVRIFPNAESCLRLVRALAVEAHENWLEANRYLNMDDLREQRKLQLREAA